jgi:methionyl-tRNA formyltransferase
MRIVFMGYSNIGHRCLEVLNGLCRQYQDEIVAVVTHADDPGENLWFESVRDLAFGCYLPLYQPQDANNQRFVEVLRRLQPDIIFSCYYRHMLKKSILELPRLGALNLHGSLLPRYRGRCPLNWVLIQGETETGVSLHYMEEKPDRGAVVAQQRVPIESSDTAYTLLGKMTEAAGELMRGIYPLLRAGQAPRLEQDHTQASYYGGRRPEDGRIDWHKSATQIYNLVRAVTRPFPGAFTTYLGKIIYIWQGEVRELSSQAETRPGQIIPSPDGEGLLVATGQGALLLQRVQSEGEAELTGPALVEALGRLQGHRWGES